MDIISHFNEFSLSKFHLAIGKFVSLPNLAWNAWLLLPLNFILLRILSNIISVNQENEESAGCLE